MLGPELLNMTVRPTPIFLEGTASLRIDQPGPRELGLANFQIVKGLVSIDRGQLFINLAGVAQPLLAPDLFRRYAGQSIFFRVQLTPDGATILRPVPAAAATPTPPTTCCRHAGNDAIVRYARYYTQAINESRFNSGYASFACRRFRWNGADIEPGDVD